MKKNYIENTIIINYMTIILNFINFDNSDFKNNKSKSKMKDCIKKNLKSFILIKDDLIKKHLKSDNKFNLDLELKKNNCQYYLTLIKETWDEKYKKTLRNKLKKKFLIVRIIIIK